MGRESGKLRVGAVSRTLPCDVSKRIVTYSERSCPNRLPKTLN